jgi:hypothetical protein
MGAPYYELFIEQKRGCGEIYRNVEDIMTSGGLSNLQSDGISLRIMGRARDLRPRWSLDDNILCHPSALRMTNYRPKVRA